MLNLRQLRFQAPKADEGSTSPADRFAFKLFRELTRGHEDLNVFFSPFAGCAYAYGDPSRVLFTPDELAGRLQALKDFASGKLRPVLSHVEDPGNKKRAN